MEERIDKQTDKQTDKQHSPGQFLRSQMLPQSNILRSKLTPWFGTEISNIIIE